MPDKEGHSIETFLDPNVLQGVGVWSELASMPSDQNPDEDISGCGLEKQNQHSTEVVKHRFSSQTLVQTGLALQMLQFNTAESCDSIHKPGYQASIPGAVL
jgi:hypothetical protein